MTGSGGGAGRGKGTGERDRERLFHSPEALAVREEICAVGWKLWARSYVDGSGGNISCRVAENAVLCTPTLSSKADLEADGLCLVDLEGTRLAGLLPPTSEVLLHNEIYKRVPRAGAVVHCHPPYATACAITGRVPPMGVIPEFDVFVGSVALVPYETPGTKAFAESVIPFVCDHNTLLLRNHGVVCWADTPTHAEWCVETLEACCQVLLVCHQLGGDCSRIPAGKQRELRAVRKRLGFPAARPVPPAGPAPTPGAPDGPPRKIRPFTRPRSGG